MIGMIANNDPKLIVHNFSTIVSIGIVPTQQDHLELAKYACITLQKAGKLLHDSMFRLFGIRSSFKLAHIVLQAAMKLSRRS